MATSISEDALKAAITNRVKVSHLEIIDMSGGCGSAFSVVIVSPEFAGKSSLKRHRLVNSALKEEIAAIHSWTLKCHTPEEWTKSQSTAASSEPSLEGTVDGKVEGTKA